MNRPGELNPLVCPFHDLGKRHRQNQLRQQGFQNVSCGLTRFDDHGIKIFSSGGFLDPDILQWQTNLFSEFYRGYGWFATSVISCLERRAKHFRFQ